MHYGKPERGGGSGKFSTNGRELVGAGAFSPDGQIDSLCPEVNLLQLIETRPRGKSLCSGASAEEPRHGRIASRRRDGLAAATFRVTKFNLGSRGNQTFSCCVGCGWGAMRPCRGSSALAPGAKRFFRAVSVSISLQQIYLGTKRNSFDRRRKRAGLRPTRGRVSRNFPVPPPRSGFP